MPKELRANLLLVFGFVFIDLLGYSLILPLLPYYAETFTASLTLVGLLGASNALAQLFAAPIIGRFSDRYGRRPLLIFSIAGTLLSFLILGLADSLFMIFLSRILDGLLGGNIALARAYITDITDDKNRSKGLGIIGAAFGLGFIFGPAMGGFLSRFGFSVPALVAAGLSFLNLIAVFIWLPESLPENARASMRSSEGTSFSLNRLVDAVRRPCVGPLLGVRLVYSLAFTLFQANFALYALDTLKLEVAYTSYILTYVGILSVLVQGVAIGPLTSKFSERRLMAMGSIVMAVSLFAWGIVPDVWLLLVVLAPIALAGGVLNVVLTSQLTKAIYREEVGGTLGLSNSLQTFAQIISPGIGGLMLEKLGAWSLGTTGSVLMFGTWVFIQSYLRKQPELTGPCPKADNPV
ncbi:MAG: MFS transporter [Anaerolineales bacterium]|nr:MFS transporter [Anaerolineales bacterium]